LNRFSPGITKPAFLKKQTNNQQSRDQETQLQAMPFNQRRALTKIVTSQVLWTRFWKDRLLIIALPGAIGNAYRTLFGKRMIAEDVMLTYSIVKDNILSAV